ncbi:hypothetical protein [Enterobacter hormaechei]|uniref:hypothetical protein n=1 Tax=Enterobacter hormaechei TaxID=158836 RepID=UPI00125B6A88|nr:hypothetical protein [Enterobacter hormaechei]VAE94190.1 Uncharacterised protein [Enterobacter hormaechei]
MSTITKESIADTIEGLERLANSGNQSVYIDMAIAGMRHLLASLEAEPVGYFGRFDADDEDLIDQCSHNISGSFPLYTTPPAPVSVPDESAVELLATDLMKRIDKITGERHSVATLSSLRVSIVEACRAAMLQGAEPVTTAYKLPEPIKDNRLNSGAEADDYYSGYQAGWNECLESVQVICEGKPDAK